MMPVIRRCHWSEHDDSELFFSQAMFIAFSYFFSQIDRFYTISPMILVNFLLIQAAIVTS